MKIQASENGVTFSVKVVPRSKRDEIAGMENDAVKIRLNAPPVEGRANEALIRFLAARLDVGRAQIEIVHGATSRTKLIRVRGITGARVQERLTKKA